MAQVRARTPFPWYNTSAFYSTSNGISNCNALQVKLDRRFSNGFQYLACYCSMWKTGRDRADSLFGKTTMT